LDARGYAGTSTAGITGRLGISNPIAAAAAALSLSRTP